MALPAAALDPGAYAGISAGAVLAEDAEIGSVDPSLDAVLQAIGAEITTDLGFGVVGFIGYKMPYGLRFDLEGGWRTVDLDEGKSSLGTVSTEGDASVVSVMLNVAYDFNLGGGWQPFVGAGIGFGFVSGELSKVDGVATGLSEGDDTVLAYQGIVGLAYQVQKGFDIFGQYRYFATDDPNFGYLTGEVRTHSFELGVRANF